MKINTPTENLEITKQAYISSMQEAFNEYKSFQIAYWRYSFVDSNGHICVPSGMGAQCEAALARYESIRAQYREWCAEHQGGDV